MANHVAPFETSFIFAKETTYGTPVATTALPCSNEPIVDLSPNGIEVPMVGRGTAEPQNEDFAVGKLASKFSFETRPDELRMKHFFSSLWQKNSGYAVGTPFRDTLNPYTAQPATFRGYSVQKILQSAVNPGTLQLAGGIVSSIKLSSTEGNDIKVAVEGMGLAGQTANVTAPGSTIAGTKRPMHYDITLTVGGAPFKPTAFDITFSNGLAAFYGTSKTITDLVLGPCRIEGSFKCSAKQVGISEINDVIGLVSQTFLLEFFTSGSGVGYQSFACDILYQSVETGAENGVETLNFKFVGAKNSTSTAVIIETAAAFT